jgi:sugar transferase EpsL
MWYRNYFKRILDMSIAFPLLVFATPVLLVTGCWILVTLGRPVLFRQRRPGINGRPFWIRKFRTMSDRRHQAGDLLPDSERLTTFGKWLRSSSLDELPELWNVLIGEMSLVGPRPLLEEYLNRYSPEQARRHDLRPGLTGWAQINGRNAIDWETRLAMDVWYVDNLGFWLDINILMKTIFKVLSRQDISADGHATCPEFVGEEINKAA